MTAYFLEKLAAEPLEITLFEASDRVGGKLWTPGFQTAPPAYRPLRYEAGAAELYDYSMHDDDPLKELVAELGLSISPMSGHAVILDGQVLASLDDVRDRLGPRARRALVDFDRAARDRLTPSEFYASDFPDGAPGPVEPTFSNLLAEVSEPVARRLVEILIHSDLATEPERTSVSYGLHNYLMNDPAYMQLYSIVGGNEQLPLELAARLRGELLLSHRVERIGGGTAGGLFVDVSRPQGTRHDEFDFVVVALPLSALPSVEFVGERLAEGVRRHRAHYDFPAHYLRITALFERPFWRDKLSDSYWMLDQFGGCCLYDESSRDPGARHGTLGWLLGGAAALELSELPDERLIELALDSLPEFLGDGRRLFVCAQIHRWVGAVNGRPGGVVPLPLDERHRPEPHEHPGLFLVGDYLFDSTINGVLDSAHHVASWIAAELSCPSAPHRVSSRPGVLPATPTNS